MLKEISIEIIRKCPNKCIHCSSFSSELCSEIIPLDVFKKTIFGAKQLGLQTVCFSGGEPFLHPQIVDMILFVHELGINSYIYSSGIFMKEGMRGPIPERILDNIAGKVTKIIFNIEASEENTYDFFMGTHGCFAFLGESIKRTVKAGIIAEGHFVPNKINKDQIEHTLEYCAQLGVSKVSFLRLVMHGRAYENRESIALSKEELSEIKQRLKRVKDENSFNIRIGVPLLSEEDESCCEAAAGKLNIRYDGKVFPCEVFKNNRVKPLEKCRPDSIFDDSIENIYLNSEYLRKTRELINGHQCNRSCEKCVGQYYMKE